MRPVPAAKEESSRRCEVCAEGNCLDLEGGCTESSSVCVDSKKYCTESGRVNIDLEGNYVDKQDQDERKSTHQI